MAFDFDQLDVYRLARRINARLALLLPTVPRGHAATLDQLRRAGLSIALNIAEGAGEFAPLEKARFYRMAKRSGTEAAAVLDYLVDYGLLTEEEVREVRKDIDRVVGKLVRLILNLDSRGKD